VAIAARAVNGVELRSAAQRGRHDDLPLGGIPGDELGLPELGVPRETVGDRLRYRRNAFGRDAGRRRNHLLLTLRGPGRGQGESERGANEMSHV
jgi:hypothetical protein